VWDAPVVVPGLANVRQVVAGASHTCALDAAGSVWCWGDNSGQQLGLTGDAGQQPSTDVPTQVPNVPTGVAQLTAGQKHTCARTEDGAVWCWGTNFYGQLGGSGGDSPVPGQVDGIAGAVDVRSGSNHTCARLLDGTAVCWGQNANGQVGHVVDGTGALIVKVTSPTKVALP
jgi:alpha-tubulin suppressor-like RCC1 family protein